MPDPEPAALVAQRLRRPAALPGRGCSCVDGSITANARSAAACTRSACARSNCARSRIEWGRSFTFVVNGVPIFAKGSNWIPADSFPTRLTDAVPGGPDPLGGRRRTRTCCASGAAASTRTSASTICAIATASWSGRTSSSRAASTRSTTRSSSRTCAIEVVENIRRLRHRASLALWCGNNEMEWGWVDWGWNRPEYAGSEGRLRPLLPPHPARLVRGRRPRPRLLAQLALVRYAVRDSQRPDPGRRALLGRLARPQAVHRLPRPVPALHERVRLPGAAAAGDRSAPTPPKPTGT